MYDGDDRSEVPRRTLLRAAGGAVALSAVGSARASDGAAATDRSRLSRRCPDATLEPSMGHCEGSSADGCADDHPVTLELRAAVAETLETRYPDAGALIDAGFKPYFDTLDGDDDGWSHWLHPEYIGDETVLDPDRPESVLVDNVSWRSIGVMFVATSDGERVEPPTLYDAAEDGYADGDAGDSVDGDSGDENETTAGADDSSDEHDPPDHEHDSDGGDDHPEGDDHHDDGRCAPWHYHAGLPGRFAWWYYLQVYEGGGEDGSLQLPCRTPCMLHVWTVDHPEGVHAHDAPPDDYRDYEPADDPGFGDAEPGEDELGWDVLPDEFVPDRTPDAFSFSGP